jgi:hypothetical protein
LFSAILGLWFCGSFDGLGGWTMPARYLFNSPKSNAERGSSTTPRRTERRF